MNCRIHIEIVDKITTNRFSSLEIDVDISFVPPIGMTLWWDLLKFVVCEVDYDFPEKRMNVFTEQEYSEEYDDAVAYLTSVGFNPCPAPVPPVILTCWPLDVAITGYVGSTRVETVSPNFSPPPEPPSLP